MRRIRVLIVDDSVVIRRLLTDILANDPEIEVVGTAANGNIALAKVPQLNPDLVTLDIEMPELDGLATLPLLRKDYPRLPVIMFNTLTERGAVATFEALARGATDYVAKPANVGSIAAGMESVRIQLIPKIKSLCPLLAPVVAVAKPAATALKPNAQRPISPTQRCDAVVIGSSTGGPQALTALLKQLPANFSVPIVIVQHMPPVFTRHLANRLNQECALDVREAAGGETLQPGQVLIAPGDFHLEIQRQGVSVRTVLNQASPENSCRPAVDVLFRSAAKVYGPALQAVVLTGMGQDGKRGSESVVQAGGTVFAQDEASSVVWGMPRAVAESGLASRILSLQSISSELLRRVAVARHTSLTIERV
jgi:two-component system chemotaxis response regulator CheB